jgi:hypothetical protein
MLLTLEELGLLLDFQRDPTVTEEIVFTRGGEEVRLRHGHAVCTYTYLYSSLYTHTYIHLYIHIDMLCVHIDYR